MNTISLSYETIKQAFNYLPDTTQLRRIGNITLSAFLLIGSALVAYTATTIDLSVTSVPAPVAAAPSCPDLGALRERVLAAAPKTESLRFGDSDYYQPQDPRLTSLVHQFHTVHLPAFQNALQVQRLRQNVKKPQEGSELLQAAKTCLEVAYTISYTTMQDTLKSISERVESQKGRSWGQGLAAKLLPSTNPLSKSYEGHAFRIFRKTYTDVKNAVNWKNSTWAPLLPDYCVLEQQIQVLNDHECLGHHVAAILAHDVGCPQ